MKTKRYSPPSPKEQQKLVDQWNEQHPIGTDVTFSDALTDPEKSKTRSAAWLMGGHTAVVLIEGRSGCVSLDCLKVGAK